MSNSHNLDLSRGPYWVKLPLEWKRFGDSWTVWIFQQEYTVRPVESGWECVIVGAGGYFATSGFKTAAEAKAHAEAQWMSDPIPGCALVTLSDQTKSGENE